MHKVFICSNHEQSIAAKISKFSILKRSSLKSEDVSIIYKEDLDFINKIEGKTILREGSDFIFPVNDMQNFTLLRFYIPELMKYKGKALVIDPDIFLIRHGLESLFSLDTKNVALYCRPGKQKNTWSTSVMMIDAEKLLHWNIHKLIESLREKKLDYRDLISLSFEKSKIGSLGSLWNEYDIIKEDTILLHTTEKITQPWRTGLPMNSSIPKLFGILPRDKIYKLFGKDLRTGREHPAPSVRSFFFDEFQDCLLNNQITIEEINNAVSNKFLRKDIFNILDA
tara:strand:+ start:476 stop:1321 length:846 start_codon:yes stop_codon:yes gene_type:complete